MDKLTKQQQIRYLFARAGFGATLALQKIGRHTRATAHALTVRSPEGVHCSPGNVQDLEPGEKISCHTARICSKLRYFAESQIHSLLNGRYNNG